MSGTDSSASAGSHVGRWSANPLGVMIPNSSVLSALDTARLMGFTTPEALAKARRAGRLSIDMFKIPGRRGWFARREEDCAGLHQSLHREEAAQ